MPRPRAPLAMRLKTLATQHIEKLVFGLCSLVAAGFVWSTLTSEVYSYTPEELISGAKVIEARMNDDDPGPPLPPGPGPFGIPPLDGEYGFDQPLFRYPLDQVVRVRTLQLLPLQSLKATFGRAPFTYTRAKPPMPVRGAPMPPVGPPPGAQAPLGQAPPQGDLTEGRRYVVLTGLIPWRDQQEIFDRLPLFRNMPASKNELRYEGFVVERTEVCAAAPDAWQVLDLQSLSDEMARWTREQPEFAAEEATLPGMAVPLAPRVTPWTAAEVVPQGIPLLGEREEVQVNEPVRPRRPFHPWNPQQAINNRNVVAQAAPRQAVGSPNRMFRVFDFTVEPEKQYRYRVRLVVQNPNFGMHPGFLMSPELAKNSFELTPASLPSELLSVPRDWQILAGPYKPASPAIPGDVRMGIEIWDPATGADAVGLLRVNLGQVLNTNLKVRYRNPLGDLEQPPLEKEMKLRTDTMLVDVFEDVLLPKERPNAPRVHACEVLMLEANGNLLRMSTATSLDRVRRMEKEFELPLTAAEALPIR